MTGDGTAMPVGLAPDADADARWNSWQIRGAEGDRRRARTMGWVTVLVGLSLAAWLLFQLIPS